MAPKISNLAAINKRLPPSLSYYLRRAIRHPSIRSYESYRSYYRARFAAEDPTGADNQSRSWISNIIASGHPEDALIRRAEIPASAWYDPLFRKDFLVVLTSLGRLTEARDFARETLLLGVYNQTSLLRMLGDAYLYGDPNLITACAQLLVSRYDERMTEHHRHFLMNTLLNVFGESQAIQTGGVRATQPSFDTYILLSNFSLARGDFAGQLSAINKAFELAGLPHHMRLADDCSPVSVENLRATASQKRTGGPLISIMMSTFNAERTLLSVLQSLSAQTYTDIEILIVDDCSTDGTVALAQAYARDHDPRVRVISMDKNGGTYRARNRGLIEARGEFFTCNDSDDWAHPTKIEELTRPFATDQRLVASIGSLVRLSKSVGVKPRPNGYMHIDLSSLLYRRTTVMERIGFYEAVPYGADSEFKERLQSAFGHSCVARVDKPLLIADWSRNSLTGTLATGITDGGTLAHKRLEYRAKYRARHSAGSLHVDLKG